MNEFDFSNERARRAREGTDKQSQRKTEKETREQTMNSNEQRQENRKWSRGKEEKRKRGKESLKERKPARKINQRGDVVNAARGSPHPLKEDLARLPKCRGLLNDDADIQRRRPRPPPHL